MSTVNIPSYLDDPNYRYKMPRVKVQRISRGNGVKTVLLNMGDIAKALKRNPDYSTRFCGCELGAMSRYDLKRGYTIINGIHSEDDVQTIIDKFIERFVLCPKCSLPEVDLLVLDRKVQGSCNACGFIGLMDNYHKVSTYICKNPPDISESTVKNFSSNKLKTSSKYPKSGKQTAGINSDDDISTEVNDPTSLDDNDAEFETIKSRHSHKKSHSKPKRQEKQKNTESESNNSQVLERMTQFHNGKQNFDLLVDELNRLVKEESFSEVEKIYIYLSILFASASISRQTLIEQEETVKKIFNDSVNHRSVLKAFEHLGMENHPEVFEEFSPICFWLYENDIVDEESFIRRYSDIEITNGEIKKTNNKEKLGKRLGALGAEKFIDWLETAESESDSD